MKLYSCKQCGFSYKTEELARKCEDWCRKHRSCNIEIAKQAVQGLK